MIKIHYLDKDQTYYKDLQTWLPEYCILICETIDTIADISSYVPAPDIMLINPDYLGNNPDFFKHFLQQLKRIPVIFICDTIYLPFVVTMVKNGAYSFFHKRNDKSLFIECIKEILYKSPEEENLPDLEDSTLNNIIGNSKSIKNLKYEILNYCGSNFNILLNGETGTGKDLTAKALHIQNFQTNKSLIAVNCSAIPETLIESELFGTKKGAFTDAIDKSGLVDKADGGTIYLDEIGELSKSAQVKLLRVLENGEYNKVGDSETRKSTFNLITATNKNLKDEIQKGFFREDLYYRIASFIIEIPPLRDRKEDIYELSQFFLKDINSIKEISHSAIMKLIEHNWPGNVRELKNTITRADYLSKKSKIIKADHIIFY